MLNSAETKAGEVRTGFSIYCLGRERAVVIRRWVKQRDADLLACAQAQESPAESRYAASEASTSSVAEDTTSLDEEVHSRAASNSQASSSRGAPGSSRLSAIGLNSYFKPGRPGGSGGGDVFSPAAQQHQQQQQQRGVRQGGQKGPPSHRRGGSWVANALDVAPDLIDTVRRSVSLLTPA